LYQLRGSSIDASGKPKKSTLSALYSLMRRCLNESIPENCNRTNVGCAFDFLAHLFIDGQMGFFPLEFGTKLYRRHDRIFRSENWNQVNKQETLSKYVAINKKLDAL
jgi:hypothetical protein